MENADETELADRERTTDDLSVHRDLDSLIAAHIHGT